MPADLQRPIPERKEADNALFTEFQKNNEEQPILGG